MGGRVVEDAGQRFRFGGPLIFHAPNTSGATLKACWRRALHCARKGKTEGHPLSILWANTKYFLCHEEEYRGEKEIRPQKAQDWAYSVVLLDHFARRVDAHLEHHMLNGDKILAAMLYEWKDAMPFDPTIYFGGAKRIHHQGRTL